MSSPDPTTQNDVVLDRAPSSSVLLQAQRDDPPTMSTPPASELGREHVCLSTNSQPTNGSEGDDFKPYQLLMETELTLEFGKKLRNTKVIHQELLCCHSKAAARMFRDAQSLRRMYAASDVLRKELKDLVPPRVTEKTFEKNQLDRKAIFLIVKIYDHYPLKSYEERLQRAVDEVILDEVGKRHVIGTPSKTQVTRKEAKDMGIQLRLEALLPKGILAVAKRLSDVLRNIKHIEKEAAKTDNMKAAAQRRYILPNAEHRVVRSLIQWLYGRGALLHDDAEHLYALHALADRLGITELAQKCLCKLATETKEMIETGLCHEMPLQELLNSVPGSENNEDTSPSLNVVQVVFRHVLEDDVAPQQLVDIVIISIADHLDPGLWNMLSARLNHDTLRQVVSAMLARRAAKNDNTHGLRFRSESMPIRDELMQLATNEQIAHVE